MQRTLLILVMLLTAAIPAAAQEDTGFDCDAKEHDAVMYYDEGWALYRDALYEDALPYFACAFEINPEYDDARHMVGLIYELTGEYTQARDTYAAVVARNPDYLISYIGLGNAYLKLEDYVSAAAAFSDYLERNPENASIYYNRAIAYYSARQYGLALEDYHEAITRDPSFADAYGGRSRTYAVLGNYDNALSDAKAAVKLEPSRKAWLYTVLGEAYTYLERYDEARAAYDTYLELVPEADWDSRVLDDIARLDALIAQQTMCLVLADRANANLRNRPDLEASVLGVLERGAQARVLGQRAGNDGLVWWWLPDTNAWVREDAVVESDTCAAVGLR